MARINSRRKGKTGELEAAAKLRELFGWRAERSQQHAGNEDSADLKCSDVPGLWIECKRVQKLNVNAVMAVAASQCGRKTPVLLHRRDREDWLLTIYLADLPRLCHAFYVAADEEVADSPLPSRTPDHCEGSGAAGRASRTLHTVSGQGADPD